MYWGNSFISSMQIKLSDDKFITIWRTLIVDKMLVDIILILFILHQDI